MKTKIKSVSLFIGLLFIGTNLFAGSDMITTKELVKIMKDNNTVIVSCRTPSDYQKVHIPGAVNVHHMTLYTEPASNGYLKSPEELAKFFGNKGISNSKTIVLYDNGSGKYAGRLYWILKYLGAQNVKILDGQMKGWRAARKPVTRAPVKVKPVVFTPHVNTNILISTPEIKKIMEKTSVILVDARSPEEFNGTDEGALKKGHIPGAINLEYKNVLNENSTIKSPEELKKIFNAKGITPDKEVVLYCATSVRAGIVFFALTDILGYKNVKVYDDAFTGWQSDSANKVVK